MKTVLRECKVIRLRPNEWYAASCLYKDEWSIITPTYTTRSTAKRALNKLAKDAGWGIEWVEDKSK